MLQIEVLITPCVPSHGWLLFNTLVPLTISTIAPIVIAIAPTTLTARPHPTTPEYTLSPTVDLSIFYLR
jgi:hypothetical protein